MRLHKQPLTWIAGLSALALAAFTLNGAPAPGMAEGIDVDVAYQSASFDQLARESNVIASGEVIRISPTLWNQDDGSYWERIVTDDAGLETIEVALPYYQIDIAAERSIVDADGILSADGAPLTLTVVGMSPLDDPDRAAEGLAVSEHSLEHIGLKEGDQALFFATAMEIDWRVGSRLVLGPTGAPGQSLLGQPEGDHFYSPVDGERTSTLDDLASRVLEARGEVSSTD